MLEVWNRKIPRADRDLEPEDVVCSLHFDPEEIEFLINKRGEPRKRPSLKKGVVPHIFPQLPARMTTALKHRPAPGERQLGSNNPAIKRPPRYELNDNAIYK